MLEFSLEFYLRSAPVAIHGQEPDTDADCDQSDEESDENRVVDGVDFVDESVDGYVGRQEVRGLALCGVRSLVWPYWGGREQGFGGAALPKLLADETRPHGNGVSLFASFFFFFDIGLKCRKWIKKIYEIRAAGSANGQEIEEWLMKCPKFKIAFCFILSSSF